MGLRVKFNLALLVACVIGLLVGAIVFRQVSIKNARAQVLENASIMITAANAIRDGGTSYRSLSRLCSAEADGSG